MKRVAFGLLVFLVMLSLIPQAASAAPPQANPIIHVVCWGENLTGIAVRYGTTIQAIMNANGLANPNRIYAGQRLIIPTASTPAPVNNCAYIVRAGDSLSGIAYLYGVSVNSIVQANNILNPNRIYAGQRLAIPCGSPVPPSPVPGGTYYVVRKGDTLAKIALAYGTSVWAIVSANNIPNPNVIYPGQRFFIPKGTMPVPSTPGTVKVGCEHLTWPREGVRLSGAVQAKGTADHQRFGYYKLEFRKDGLDDWHYITGAESPVRNGALGMWDTRTVPDGRYTFRLVIVDQTGNYPPPCEIAVTVDN